MKAANKKLLIGIVAVISVGAGIYFLTRLKSNSPSGNPNQAKINISGQGFTPNSLEISAGTQVTWINTDSADHQVAADPYPKNNSIPGFDSTVILNTGESYSFTFEKSGTYTYHDEENPLKFHGTVVVQ